MREPPTVGLKPSGMLVTHRSRKNFAEALIIMVVNQESNTIDLSKLGIIERL